MGGKAVEPHVRSAPITVRVLFFAAAKELVGVSSIVIEVEPETTPFQALNNILVPNYPALAPLASHCALAVNLEYAVASKEGHSPPLRDGDELAVIPPISGG
jgi:molybdopterin converting factor subunit 1